MTVQLEAWANGGAVWLARPSDNGDGWIRIDTIVEVDELIAALEEAKRQAFPPKEVAVDAI